MKKYFISLDEWWRADDGVDLCIWDLVSIGLVLLVGFLLGLLF